MVWLLCCTSFELQCLDHCTSYLLLNFASNQSSLRQNFNFISITPTTRPNAQAIEERTVASAEEQLLTQSHSRTVTAVQQQQTSSIKESTFLHEERLHSQQQHMAVQHKSAKLASEPAIAHQNGHSTVVDASPASSAASAAPAAATLTYRTISLDKLPLPSGTNGSVVGKSELCFLYIQNKIR